MPTVVLFGATGFVGRNLAIALAAEGRRVIALSRSGATVPEAAVSLPLSRLHEVEALPDDAVVVHVAAQRYDASRFEMGQSDILTSNVELSNRVYEFCAERGVTEVRLASSVAVYQAGLPLMDDAQAPDLNKPPHRNEAFYAWSKRWGEILASLYEDRYGVATVAFRLSNPYGPHDSLDAKAAHVAPAFVMRALGPGDEFLLKGDPKVSRDFVWVGDVVEVFRRSLEWKGRSERYNLCSGAATTLYDLAQTVIDLSGRPKRLVTENDFAPAAVPVRASSAERVKAAFGVGEFTPLRDGMAQTVEWYREAMAHA